MEFTDSQIYFINESIAKSIREEEKFLKGMTELAQKENDIGNGLGGYDLDWSHRIPGIGNFTRHFLHLYLFLQGIGVFFHKFFI